MPSLGSFATDLISSLGGKPTPQAKKLFGAFQRKEGGWTHNTAAFNPLNLTAPGSGLPTMNSVGVVIMPSYQAGVKRTADLISSGYPAIAKALRTGRVNFQNPALQADFNRWLTGKRTPGASEYVSKIASYYGANLPVATTPVRGQRQQQTMTPATPAAAAPAVPQKPIFDPMAYANQVLGAYAAGGRADLSQLPGVVSSSFKVPPPPPAAPVAATPAANLPPGAAGPTGATDAKGHPIKYVGKKMVLPTKWKSTHPTSGLSDQGFTHAEDIMAHPGTPVGSPVSGTIIRTGSAQGGSSIYLQGDDGRVYWIGHIEPNVRAGQKVKRGQTIAAVSADHAAPHVHIDYSTTYKP